MIERACFLIHTVYTRHKEDGNAHFNRLVDLGEYYHSICSRNNVYTYTQVSQVFAMCSMVNDS